MNTNEIKEMIVALQVMQRDLANGLPIEVFGRADEDECGIEFLRPDEDSGEFKSPVGDGWVQIRTKKEKQDLLADALVRLAQELSQSTSRRMNIDQRPLLASWQLKGARKRAVAITHAPPFLQGGAPGLVQQK
jgi:hypothetical protein